jgi:hypothetical protein
MAQANGSAVESIAKRLIISDNKIVIGHAAILSTAMTMPKVLYTERE